MGNIGVINPLTNHLLSSLYIQVGHQKGLFKKNHRNAERVETFQLKPTFFNKKSSKHRFS